VQTILLEKTVRSPKLVSVRVIVYIP